MVKRFDHVTLVVRDMEEATHFFGLLGFEVDIDVLISGGVSMGDLDLVLCDQRPCDAGSKQVIILRQRRWCC